MAFTLTWGLGRGGLTILQWLERGGRYILHVGQYLTRTLYRTKSKPKGVG